MSADLRTALIAAAAVLAAGAIAAGASYWTTVVAQKKENERIERRLDEEARGAARVLVSRFATTINYVDAAMQMGEYATFAPRFVSDSSAADLKLITARLSVEGFQLVDAALRNTSSSSLVVEASGGKPLGRGDRERLRQWRRSLWQAIHPLSEVADLAVPPARAIGQRDPYAE